MQSSTPTPPIELRCPGCNRYLGTVDGAYFAAPPCSCGLQTTVRATGKRLRQGYPAGLLKELEVK